jgi:hypothetical protein
MADTDVDLAEVRRRLDKIFPTRDELVAETAQLRILEVAPGDWRLSMVFDHTTEVISDESFPTCEEAVEVILDRLEECVDPDQVRTERTQ